MRAVNLLPPDRASSKSGGSRSSSIALPAIGVVTAAVIAGLVFAVWTTNSSVTSKQQQLDAIQAKIAKLPQPAPAPTTASSVASRSSTVTSLVDARLPWDEFLGTFSRVLPENVWLSSLQASSAGAAATAAVDATTGSAAGAVPATPTAGATNFSISGFTYSQPSVARLMRRLTLIPWISDVSLVSSSKTTLGNATVYQFTLGATIVPQPGGTP
jgi:Tfp pilus assembly protein PilN